LFLSDFNETFNFSDRFSKNTHITIFFNENPSIGSRVVPSVRTDRQTWQSK